MHPTNILLALIITISQHYQLASGEAANPFCSYCVCLFRSGDAVHINCTDVDVVDFLYDSTFWIDEFDAQYRVASFTLKRIKLPVLDKEMQPSSMRSLDLSENGIEYIADGAFARLQDLEVLNLGFNEIVELTPDVFKGSYAAEMYYPLKSLKILDLRHNKLTSLNEDLFEHIDKIEELFLGGNQFLEIGASMKVAIKSLPFLKTLDLSYTGLSTLPTNFFHNHKYLDSVDLSGNNFVSIPQVLGELEFCEFLNMDANPVYILDISNAFPAMPALNTLHMSYMPNLEEVKAFSLRGLKYLEELYMHDNPALRRIHARAFDGEEELSIFPELEVLDLSNDNLSYLEIDFLPNWDGFRTMELYGNPWYCDCKNQWMIDYLVGKTFFDSHLQCEGPLEIANITFHQLKENNTRLYCTIYSYGLRNVHPVVSKFVIVVSLLAVCALLYCLCCRKRRSNIVYVSLKNLATD